MNPSQIAGGALFALGAVLLWLAYGESNAPLDEVTLALTGRHTDRIVWYIVGGTVAVVGGGLLAMFGRRSL
jgi:hypothetical protein